jgi:parallel beta-helix repeat protein
LLGLAALLLGASPALPATFYVDVLGYGTGNTPGAFPCSDSRTSAQAQNPNTPWCKPGRALSTPFEWLSGATADGTIPGYNNQTFGGNLALSPGDTIYIRKGTYSEPYCVNDGNTFCSIMEGDATYDKGTAAQPITISAYPGDEGQVFFDPQGKLPPQLYWGISFRVESSADVCYGGPTPGATCTSTAQCGSGGYCSNSGWYWVIKGISFTNWDYVYGYPNASYNINADPRRSNPFVVPPGCGANCPGYAGSHSAVLSAQGDAPHGMVTFDNCDFYNNEGGGVLNLRSTFGFVIKNSRIRDNWTKGWTSPINIINSHGWLQRQANVVENNDIYNNRDTPPVWCLDGNATDVPWREGSYCTDPDGNTTAADDNECNDTVNGGGYLCPCKVGTDCESGICAKNNSTFDNCDNDLGYDEGDTEGNGIIIDRATGTCSTNEYQACAWPADPICGGGVCNMGNAGYNIIQNNRIWDNWGFGITSFLSSQTIIRNNTFVRNAKRNRLDYGIEVVSWGRNVVIANNIMVPRAEGQCFCTSDAQCAGGGKCDDKLITDRICRNKASSYCTADNQCASGRCIFKAGYQATYGGFHPSSNATNQYYSANVVWNGVLGPNDNDMIRQSTGGPLFFHTPTTLKALTDAVNNGWAGNGTSKNFQIVNPLLTGPLSGTSSQISFQPALGSPVLQAGDGTTRTLNGGTFPVGALNWLVQSVLDYFGVTRANPGSIGAYELGSGQTTTSTVATTTTTSTSTTTTTTLAGSTTTSTTSTTTTTVVTTTTLPKAPRIKGGGRFTGGRF